MSDKIIYTFNSMNFVDVEISIDKSHLIKPEDLHKHIGEVLIFHNGCGYIVSGVLKSVKLSDNNEYSYAQKYEKIDYEDELDMDLYYQQNDRLAEYNTLQYAYVIKILGIHQDEIMHNIKYIAVPSEEELAFREKIFTIDNNKLSERYNELKKEFDND